MSEVDGERIVRVVYPKTCAADDEHGCAIDSEAERDVVQAAVALGIVPDPRRPVVPVKMVLCCPACELTHRDEGEWETRVHRTHLCAWCGHEWRPYPFATVGVLFDSEADVLAKPRGAAHERPTAATSSEPKLSQVQRDAIQQVLDNWDELEKFVNPTYVSFLRSMAAPEPSAPVTPVPADLTRDEISSLGIVVALGLGEVVGMTGYLAKCAMEKIAGASPATERNRGEADRLAMIVDRWIDEADTDTSARISLAKLRAFKTILLSANVTALRELVAAERSEYPTAVQPAGFDPIALCVCGHKRSFHAYTWSALTPNEGAPSRYDAECSVCSGDDATEDDDMGDEPCEAFVAAASTPQASEAQPTTKEPEPAPSPATPVPSSESDT